MLKPEIKQKWLEALRSGRYQQAKDHLRVGYNYYCCLGVLCDISNIGEWSRGNNPMSYHYLDKDATDYPPIAVIDYVLVVEAEEVSQEGIKVSELKDPAGFAGAIQRWAPHRGLKKILEDRVFDCLATINDRGVGFEDIAQIIEQYL